MSHIALTAMETLWPSYVLVVLFSAHAAHCHKGSQGLSCVSDFISNVSCTWKSTAVAPGVDCWIRGAKKTWPYANSRVSKIIIQSCKVEQHGASPPGCSIDFKKEEFDFFDVIPISVECGGKLLANLTDYKPRSHIKMNPPGVPNVSSSANETWISWSPGRPQSNLLSTLDFQIQIKLKEQTWKEVSPLYTQERQLKIPTWKLKGHNEVRVRVKPSDKPNSIWSDWSPTASWMEATDVATTPRDQDNNEGWPVDQTALLVMLSVGLFVVLLVIYMGCLSGRHLKMKPVPNPSKYFPTLHSVHRGNLKKWLNPLSASQSFFTAQPRDHISPVEVCKSWDVVPSASPSSSSSSALLQIRKYPSAGSDTSGVVNNSSSSSWFSNMGYFMSSSSGSIVRTDPCPAYFIYQDDFRNKLRLSLCPSLTTSQPYESLKREPQSPDSGFGIGQEDEEDKRDEKGVDAEGEEVSGDHQSSPLIILPLHVSTWVCPPSSSAAFPHPPSLSQICCDSQEVDDVPVAAACGSYAAWPVAGAMCRSSSMPVEQCKTGYLTLKELQTTFSNKSI